MTEKSKIDDMKQKAQLVLGTMLDYLGLEADLSSEEKGNKLIIKITSNDAGRIIGRRGTTLESLQLLVNRIVFKGEEDSPMIALDIDGYSRGTVVVGDERRERRSGDRRDRRGSRRNGDRSRREDSVPEEQLRQLALDKAKEVKRWGQPVELAKMNAHDRRIIHINLQDDPEIETRSEGEGALKSVIISLKKSEN